MIYLNASSTIDERRFKLASTQLVNIVSHNSDGSSVVVRTSFDGGSTYKELFTLSTKTVASYPLGGIPLEFECTGDAEVFITQQ